MKLTWSRLVLNSGLHGDTPASSRLRYNTACTYLKKAVPPRHADANGRGVELLLILHSGIRWGEWSASRRDRALPHWIGGWVGLRAGLDTEARGKILCFCWGSNPGRPVCNLHLKIIHVYNWRNIGQLPRVVKGTTSVRYGFSRQRILRWLVWHVAPHSLILADAIITLMEAVSSRGTVQHSRTFKNSFLITISNEIWEGKMSVNVRVQTVYKPRNLITWFINDLLVAPACGRNAHYGWVSATRMLTEYKISLTLALAHTKRENLSYKMPQSNFYRNVGSNPV
jgi:hypothetical protein